MRALMSSPFSLFFFTFSLSRDCQLTLWELAGDSCRGRLLGRVASILGRRLSTPLPAPALTPLQPALSPAARVILVRHQSLIRVLPRPQLSSHPPPFSALFPPSLHFPCGIFFPPQIKRVLMYCLPWNVSLSNKRGTLLPQDLALAVPSCWNPLSSNTYIVLSFTRNVKFSFWKMYFYNVYQSTEFEKRIDACICVTESYCLRSHISLKVFTLWGYPWPFYFFL